MTHPATVSDFRLEKYEVTVGRFRAFVESGFGIRGTAPSTGAGAHPHLANSGWDPSWDSFLAVSTPDLKSSLRCGAAATWTDQRGGNENLPINCVNWYEAMAFCIWDAGYLPTAAEWGYAGQGGSEQRVYPWSSPPGSFDLDCTYTTYLNTMKTCSNIVTVGTKPAGDARWGQSDMGGNVGEWVLDWDAVDVSTMPFKMLYISPCVDCARLQPDSQDALAGREIRGGQFDTISIDVRVANVMFNATDPIMTFDDLGFRCAGPPM